MSTKSRRIELINILSVRKHDTIPNLAHSLSVSVATIHRDILALKESGHVIDTIQGKGGGVRYKGNNNQLLSKFSPEQVRVVREIAEMLDGYHSLVLHGILDTYT
ncbi:MAG: HTH domain-containing protein [Defluviitaleaceae bacterium]|nr:HTH domain-containing protein [Defluviitaleaceae bacterium]